MQDSVAGLTIDFDDSCPKDEIKSKFVSNKIKTYNVGTLSYTMTGLIVLFSFLLWGEFCWILLETVIPRIFPLLLKDLEASNTLIGIMVSSVPSVLYLSLIPSVSVKSDRHRGRYGRRIPYLLLTAPFVTIFLVMIGYSNDIGRFVYESSLGRFIPISEGSFLLAMICLFIVVFQLFNTTLNFIYKCLIADVVPKVMMGRFMAMTRAVSTVASFLFSRYFFGFADGHMRQLLFWIGVVHLAAFLMLCFGVKEGQYSEPEKELAKTNRLDSIKKYINECFGCRYYLYIYLMAMFFMIACGCSGPFNIFFYRDTLGLTIDEIGKFWGWIYLFQALTAIPMGWVCDKFNPVRIHPLSILMVFVLYVLQSIFIHDKITLYVFSFIWAVPISMYYISLVALTVTLFPKDKYAQYNSGIQVLNALGLIAGNFFIGFTIDIWGNRMALIWPAVFCFPAAVLGLYVYRGWVQYGGDESYVAPR
ncbi:MAG: MFS transporter [Sedimentisphaeraceae bacterium JB056]